MRSETDHLPTVTSTAVRGLVRDLEPVVAASRTFTPEPHLSGPYGGPVHREYRFKLPSTVSTWACQRAGTPPVSITVLSLLR